MSIEGKRQGRLPSIQILLLQHHHLLGGLVVFGSEGILCKRLVFLLILEDQSSLVAVVGITALFPEAAVGSIAGKLYL